MPAVGYALDVLLHVLSPEVGYALLSSITSFWTNIHYGILDLRLLCLIVVLFPRPIFWLLVTKVIHMFVFTQSAGLSCARSPASLLASASVSPRECRTHTVFAVWCLGSSRACGVRRAVRRPRADPRVLFRTLSSRVVRGLVSPELGSSRHGRGFRRAACCVAVLCVAENTSLLEPLCTFRLALLCSISRDRALSCSGSSSSRRHPSQVISLSTDAIVVWLSPLQPPGCSPAEALCDSPQLSPLRLAMCLVVSGHFSTQTCSN